MDGGGWWWVVAWFSLIQKFVYLDNEKRFQDEIKNNISSFKRAFIEGNKTIFFKGEIPTRNLDSYSPWRSLFNQSIQLGIDE